MVTGPTGNGVDLLADLLGEPTLGPMTMTLSERLRQNLHGLISCIQKVAYVLESRQYATLWLPLIPGVLHARFN